MGAPRSLTPRCDLSDTEHLITVRCDEVFVGDPCVHAVSERLQVTLSLPRQTGQDLLVVRPITDDAHLDVVVQQGKLSQQISHICANAKIVQLPDIYCNSHFGSL